MDHATRFRPATPNAGPPGSRRRLGPAGDHVELALRFRSGEPGALGVVYRHYGAATWSVAFAVLGDQSLADDTVQETFVRAWRAAPRFDPSRPLEPWLFSIARRAAVDVYRREMRPTRGDHAPERDVAVGDVGVETAWQRWEVQRALAELSEAERELVLLTHLYGYTQRQVAEHLGIPVGTVKSRARRARRRLALLLGHLRHPEPEPERTVRPATGRPASTRPASTRQSIERSAVAG